MAFALRADDPPRDERVERVRQGISESIAPFDFRVGDDQDVRAEILSVDLGMVRIVRSSGNDIVGEVVRTPRLIRRSDPDFCKIDLQLHGRTVLDQDGSQAELRAGTFTFVDLSRPCQLVGGLNHCHRDLTDPAMAGRPVSAIGARWGFIDATHFARAFKAQYGATPSQYRRLCTHV